MTPPSPTQSSIKRFQSDEDLEQLMMEDFPHTASTPPTTVPPTATPSPAETTPSAVVAPTENISSQK